MQKIESSAYSQAGGVLMPDGKLIDLEALVSNSALKSFFHVFGSPLEHLLSFEGINEIYRGVRREYPQDRRFFSACVRSMRMEVEVSDEDVRRIPGSGGLLLVANHPYGALDAIALGDLLTRVRGDIKVMANSMLSRMPETTQEIIPVNPFGGQASIRQNLSGMKQALRWLMQGGVLVVFPAGEVSHFHISKRRVTDPVWSEHVAQLALKARVPVLPAYFHGQNSLLFQFSGMVHPRLRTLLLAREVLEKKQSCIRIALGKPMAYGAWHHLEDPGELIRFFRSATYALEHRHGAWRAKREGAWRVPVQAVAPQEMNYLQELRDPERGEVLVSQGKLEVRIGLSSDFPETLKEVGRLRELAFRAVGEGSGKARDLDAFDDYYHHLVLWNRESGEMMGGYRLGLSDGIIARHGINGLYTASLFKLKPEFFRKNGAAIELGRSFVVPGHQRSYSALSLLWKGIGAFVVRNPRYVNLFGPVSISADYHPLSQNLMIQYLTRNAYDRERGRWVKPTNPPKFKFRQKEEFQDVSSLLDNVDEVSALVSYLEHDDKGVPVLLRQYLKMNAKLLSFNVDHEFSDVLDGLMLTDLRQVDRPLLNRFLGERGAEYFLARAVQGATNPGQRGKESLTGWR